MSEKLFVMLLASISIFVAVVLFFLHRFEGFNHHQSLSWIACIFFILFTIVVYKGARMTALSENKQLFGQFFLVATALKMFISLTMVLVYFVLAKPIGQYFIIPFFFIYLCFTVFEVYFMTILGNLK